MNINKIYLNGFLLTFLISLIIIDKTKQFEEERKDDNFFILKILASFLCSIIWPFVWIGEFIIFINKFLRRN